MPTIGTRLQTVLHSVAVIAVFGASSGSVGCASSLHGEDEARYRALRDTFAASARFEFVDPYVRMVLSQDVLQPENEARNAFQVFWMEGALPRADSDFVYLNVYDSNERFLFQLYWEPTAKLIRSGRTEYH